MREMKDHTAGPWKFQWNGHYFDITIGTGAYDPTVATVHLNHVLNQNADDAEANARLIAASPELLDALKYARRYMKHEDHDTVWIDGIIAKAEGHSIPSPVNNKARLEGYFAGVR